MSLIFQFVAPPDSTAENLLITDTTGDYDAITNPGGWGAPNPTQADLFPVEGDFVKPQAYLVLYSHCTNSFVPPLNVALIFQDKQWLQIPNDFPFNPTATINMLAEYGLITLPDGAYSVEILLKSENEEYPNYFATYNFAITVGMQCCLSDTANAFLTTSCNDATKKKWTNLKNNYDAIQYALDCGNFTAACNAIANINNICNQNGGVSCGC
jgi:hypothetical protein